MKKSILSLSAAVALGGLGIAGTANAWVAYDETNTAATLLVFNNSGVGHQLFTPYYTANNGMATLVNIVNTDNVNGKAVKVRFRGATNSDDVLDFTLFLSPGDVWAGAVLQGADGRASLSTPDKSCTIPEAAAWAGGVPFKTERLPSYVTGDNLAALTREGYVEVLTMADIRKDSALYKATKHKNGVAPCETLDYDGLLSTDADVSAARAYGLDNPTGGLMGSWSILDFGHMGTYSGVQTAVVATAATQVGPDGTVPSAPANMVFFPQLEAAVGFDVSGWTADPLLTGTAPILQPLWFDLPDMSTPALAGDSPVNQADGLSLALSKTNVINEYIATAPGAAVPFTTDWVVSQPTRRYHAAVNYATSAATAAIVTRAGSDNPYEDRLTLDRTPATGPVACMDMSFANTDREEKAVKISASGGFSPGSVEAPKKYCGEVFVAQFGAESSLQAAITKRALTPVGEAGWGTLGVPSGAVPIVGYAATLFTNEANGNKYGLSFTHRWMR